MAKHIKKEENLEINKVQSKLTYKKVRLYFYLTILTFFLSFLSIYIIYKIIGDTNVNFYSLFKLNIIIPCLICLVCYFFFDGIRFYYILRSLDVRVSKKLLAKVVFLNMFVSNITPSAVGGGFIQIFYLKKGGVNIGDATAATVIRTVITVVFFIIFVPIVILTEKNIRNTSYNIGIIFYTIVILLLYIFVIFFTVYKSKLFKKIIFLTLRKLKRKKIISRKRFKKINTFFLREISIYAFSMLNFLKTKPYYTILSVIFSGLFLFSSFTFSVIIIKGLGYDIPITSIIAYQVMVMFLMYFAPTPGSTGIAEGAYSFLFSGLIRSSDIVIVTAAWRFFTIYIGVIMGLIIFYFDIAKGFFNSNKDATL
ncbi:MAG: lysylphosphatidylglycerol synthase transmembrane domain-containing protein [Deferribacterota bacterium]|nr:lysylphosphatidylglycerol synthase transmembrane domain-containing protein [Deferribacterota bacterium]